MMAESLSLVEELQDFKDYFEIPDVQITVIAEELGRKEFITKKSQLFRLDDTSWKSVSIHMDSTDKYTIFHRSASLIWLSGTHWRPGSMTRSLETMLLITSPLIRFWKPSIPDANGILNRSQALLSF